MSHVALKYVERFKDRHGKLRYYFRRGGKRIPLPGLPGSAEFMAAYQTALADSSPPEIGAARTVAGTVNAAIVAFYKSGRYLDNKPITRRTDRYILEAFRAKHGDKPIALLERRHIERILAEKAGKPGAQRNLLRVVRVLLGFCVEQGWREDNPALGIKLKKPATTGFHSWTDEELQKYEKHFPVGSKERLAFALLLWTAQRRADVVRLGSSNIVMKGGEQWLQFVQSKTGAAMDIPVAPPLASIISATPMVGVKTFLVTDYGKPFTAAGFGGWFRERCDRAGLPNCSAHGLRKAFLRRGAELRWSEDLLASISGHRNMDEIRTYVRAANRALMASDAMKSMVAAFPGNGKGTS